MFKLKKPPPDLNPDGGPTIHLLPPGTRIVPEPFPYMIAQKKESFNINFKVSKKP
jgi:hypothetical protein